MDTEINLGKSPLLKQQVYDAMMNLIIKGDFEPGRRLTEDELSRSMSISRAPIREALNMLERDGFVQIIPRKGAVVAQASEKDLRDVWDCRMVVEPAAAVAACPNIPRDELNRLLDVLVGLEEKFDFDTYMQSDIDVHSIYSVYLDNDYMQQILSNLKAHSLRIRWISECYCKESEPKNSVLEHKRIVWALLDGEPEEIYNAVHDHIKNARDRILISISE